MKHYECLGCREMYSVERFHGNMGSAAVFCPFCGQEGAVERRNLGAGRVSPVDADFLTVPHPSSRRHFE